MVDTRTELRIVVTCSFAKQTAIFEDSITQREDESDEDFLKRAAVVLEWIRHRSK